MGFGGEGLQVRMFSMSMICMICSRNNWPNSAVPARRPVYNVGGGMESLRELTQFCQEFSGKRIEMVQSSRRVMPTFHFMSAIVRLCKGPVIGILGVSLNVVLENMWQWLVDHRDLLEPILRS
jgi:hypothetical protein